MMDFENYFTPMLGSVQKFTITAKNSLSMETGLTKLHNGHCGYNLTNLKELVIPA